MPPRGPTKAPYAYVHQSLLDFGVRGITDAFLRRIAVDHRTLIPLNRLRSRFESTAQFQDFKTRYMRDIPDEHWETAVRNNDRLQSYANRFMRNPFKRRPVKLRTYVKNEAGLARHRSSPVSDDESILSIDRNNDTCDDTNVNLPKSVCRGIRSVCRYYDDHERYADWDIDDGTEQQQYTIDVDYEGQPTTNAVDDDYDDDDDDEY
ncbi:hypothetical protein JTE90_011127 [Oedothorax gibbosus]|uniref:Uncharacterized protein n=1 Tax=Oedothorax gibbosus TaxID=931172 RepID=A0AAV6TEB4_9ARAC|nr:hypothetical protein JTE90_011127 [Oedothorax gibbosus]